ncbi:universal stress protein [Salarchaeum sp. JOR-1]|uniref:universal stress protein n=1 Tax=Salarchaeum sp. JOR-1 TaxID=2599399 RepID=UPI001198B530|nr:universal stress protein [Salarchaeum sp. JOR-1]QDX39893.1 universal stress protein [Salarchaeum sp. JOR-1]
MYEVLLPVGESEARAKQAADVVTDFPSAAEEISVVVLNVFEDFEVSGEAGHVSSDSAFEGEISDAHGESFPSSVDAAVDHLEDAGVEVSKRREEGEAAEVVPAVAEELDVDNIVMSARKRSPTGKLLFGSTTQATMLSVDRPVTVITSE